MRTVLLCQPTAYYQGVNWTNNYSLATQYLKSWLSSMGYQVDERPLEDASTFASTLTAASYEFIVIPHLRGASWTTWSSGSDKPIGQMLKGNVPITVFALGIDQDNNALILANVGAGPKAVPSSNSKVLWRNCDWYMPRTAYSITQQAHMGSLGILQTDGTGAYSVAWRYHGANGWVYVQAGQQYNGIGHSLHLLMVEAIEAGHILPPPLKHRLVIDVDDMPAGDTATSIRILDVERVYAAQQRMKMPCSWGLRPEDWVGKRVPPEVTQFIAARTADKGGLLYPVVHSGLWYWKDGTKSEKQALFFADLATFVAANIRVGRSDSMVDQWGYMYVNNNAYDEETFQLASPETAIWCDPTNSVVKTGYGWKVARLDTFNAINNEGYGVPRTSSAGLFSTVRGTRLIGSWTSMASSDVSVDFDDGGAGGIIAANSWSGMFTQCGMRRASFYMHGQNCFIDHDGGNAPCTRILESFASLYEAGMHKVVQYVHGSELAIGVS